MLTLLLAAWLVRAFALSRASFSGAEPLQLAISFANERPEALNILLIL